MSQARKGRVSRSPDNKAPDKAGVGTRVAETDGPTPRVDESRDLRVEPRVAYVAPRVQTTTGKKSDNGQLTPGARGTMMSWKSPRSRCCHNITGSGTRKTQLSSTERVMFYPGRDNIQGFRDRTPFGSISGGTFFLKGDYYYFFGGG